MHTTKNPETIYYQTKSLCPDCMEVIPGKVISKNEQVFVARTCEEHGYFEGLICSDKQWYDKLKLFDVEGVRPKKTVSPSQKGCPDDCGLCSQHKQMAGTAAVEISNVCNVSCPTCLADNQETFEMTVEDVQKNLDHLLESQDHVDAFTLSGGEPTIHPQLFDIIKILQRPEVGRIVINSNGLRIAEDDAFLDKLAEQENIYVCLHYDGSQAMKLRGVASEIQERALRRLCERNINVTPLVLAAQGVNDHELGDITTSLLTRSQTISSIILSMMTYTGSRGTSFPGDPHTRLTVAGALTSMEESTKGVLKKQDFMPLPMPNPLCVAIGYFMTMDDVITPLIPLVETQEMIDFAKNSNFVDADDRVEDLFRSMIDRVYANPDAYDDAENVLKRFKRLITILFPEDRTLSNIERRKLAEKHLKLVYVMQFMDTWSFDSKRMSKCSCIHLLPNNQMVPSCGYYTYHRRSDSRFN